MRQPRESDSLRQYSQVQMLPQQMVDYLYRIRDVFHFEPLVVYDIGANVLHWTNVAQKVWPSSEFVLFDATDSTEFLYSENNFLYHLGILSDENGKVVDFFQNDESPGGNSYYRENVIYSPAASYLYDDAHIKKMVSRTLDDVVNEKSFPKPSLVKIDVQGAELDILKGGVRTIASCSHLIVELRKVEYNIGAPAAQEVIDFLESLGFASIGEFCGNDFDGDYHFINIQRLQ